MKSMVLFQTDGVVLIDESHNYYRLETMPSWAVDILLATLA